MSNLAFLLFVLLSSNMLPGRLAQSNQSSFWPNVSTITVDDNEKISTVTTTTTTMESKGIKNDMEEINSSQMYSNLEAELSADGSMHVKPAATATHVIDVSRLPDNLFIPATELPESQHESTPESMSENSVQASDLIGMKSMIELKLGKNETETSTSKAITINPSMFSISIVCLIITIKNL